MPDIDSLSIRLTSSSSEATRAIQAVIDKLGSLNMALNNYTDDSKFVRGMNSLTGGLNGLSTAVKSIDVDKLKTLSSTLGTLAGNGEKMAKLNFVQTFSQFGSEAQKANSQIKNTVKDIASQFDIPKRGIKSLTAAVTDFYNANGDTSKMNKAEASIKNIVHQYNDLTKVATEAQLAFREMQQQNKIYLPKEVRQNWGDDWKTKRGILGIFGSTTKMDNGTSIEVWAKDFNALGLEMLDVDNGIQACADSMVELLSKGNEIEIDILKEKMEALEGVLKNLRGEITSTSAAAQSLNADETMLSMPKSTMGEDVYEDAVKATSALNMLDTAMDNVQAEMNVQLENPFQGLIMGLESLKDVNIPAEKFAGIQTLANSLSKFGGKNVDKAIASIPLVGRSFASMAKEMANIPAISDNLVKLAQALAQFSKQANTASTSSNNFSKSTNVLHTALNRALTSSMRTRKGFTSLASVFGRLYANFFLLIRAARALGNAMDYSSSMTEAQNVVSVVFGKSADVMDKFAQTAIKDFGMARLSATEFASRFQAMGSTMGITAEQVGKANDFIRDKISGNTRAYEDLGDSVADMSINLTKLTADMASLFNQDYADVAADMQAIYTGMTRPLRKYGLDLTQATLKEWAMANGLDADIEKMSQAEKTMLRYQYVMSRTGGVMGDFQKTADTWANSMRTVKQLLQEIARTIGEALINALRPALLAFKKFLFGFLDATEAALNALGKLLGWKQIDFGGASLIEDTEDYADALDDAAGAAKKLKGQLRGIDELNNLTSNQGGGGGAGGTSGIGAGIDSIWDQIKETEWGYESTVKDWFDFGRRISDYIKSGLEDIDWQTIYGKASTFGRNFAKFLNGLIDPETWRLFGKTLAGGLMTAIEFMFSFGDEFDFENLGLAIAEGINGFFAEFDGGKLADTIDVWVQGIEKLLSTAFSNIDWDEVFKDLKDIVLNLDDKTLEIIGEFALVSGGALAIGAALTAAIAAAGPLDVGLIVLTATFSFVLGTKIGEAIETALGVDEITGESYWYEIWEKIFDAFFGAAKWVKENKWTMIPTELYMGGVGNSNNLREKLFGSGDPKDAKSYLSLLKKNATEFEPWFFPTEIWMGGGAKSFDGEGILSKLDEFFLDLGRKVEDFKEDFGENWEEFWTTVFDFWNMGNGGPLEAVGFFDWLDEKSNTAIQWFTDLSTKIDWTNLIDNLGKLGSNLVAFIDPANATGITSVGDAFKLLNNDENLVKDTLGTLIEKFGEFKTNTKEALETWLEEDVKPIFDLETWLKMASTIYESFSQTWEETKAFWVDAITGWWNEDVVPWFDKQTWIDTLSNITGAFEDVWSNAKELARGFFNSIADFAENFVNGVIDGFATLANAKGILSGSPVEFNVPHINIPRFANGGYPQVGSLFIAGELGSEMVGSINGKTGVASNAEITGISDTIRNTSSVEIELLRQQNTLLQGILDKEFGISRDDIFRSVRTSARDFTKSTGRPAFN